MRLQLGKKNDGGHSKIRAGRKRLLLVEWVGVIKTWGGKVANVECRVG